MRKKRFIGGGLVILLIIFGLVINFQGKNPIDEPEVVPEPICAKIAG
jgi:hypothetical protein